jgi:hypothetical protein
MFDKATEAVGDAANVQTTEIRIAEAIAALVDPAAFSISRWT